MPFRVNDESALDIYLDARERRHFVGRLRRFPDGTYEFEYDDAYQLQPFAISIGPGLPVTQKLHKSTNLFPEFLDRLPSRQNAAYLDYCHAVGISPDETDEMILLAKLGKGGPSKFTVETVFIENFENIAQRLKELIAGSGLSQDDVMNSLDMPRTTFQRVIKGKSKDVLLMRLLDLYLSNEELYIDLLQFTGARLLDAKRRQLASFLVRRAQASGRKARLN